ncbi:F-box/kelch-repeat protein At1g57790-like [Papaver somniferum]|uniref:F-box/kelch-repeat protein At1g57790-like n=1 Tax=Papaver somniferum TaxID=3469 RepID=UPI000E6FD068|nr:F-box/kelch-repeat protein At1g57790-like [Papaver somniferum]
MIYNEKYQMNLPELLVGAIIRFSKDGWLLMSKGDRTLFFYSPFTREIIQLPDVPHEYNTHYIFCGISFSSLPTSSDCVVFGIAEWYRPNDEKKELLIDQQVMLLIIEKVNDVWKPYKFHADNSRKLLACYNNPVFYKGNFYALAYNGTLGVFNLEDSRDQINFDKSNWKVIPKTLTQFDGVNPSYLVECEGELLLVIFERPFGKLVEIFKMDPCKMKWVKVKSLGNYSLFISHTSSFSVIAPDSSIANKIYFSRLNKGLSIASQIEPSVSI